MVDSERQFPPLQPPKRAEEPEVFLDREGLVDTRALRGEADGALSTKWFCGDVPSVDVNPPRVGTEQSSHDGEECGLAGTVGPKESDDLPRCDRQIDAAERLVTGVGLLHTDHLEGCVSGHLPSVVRPKGCLRPDQRPHPQPIVYVRYETECKVPYRMMVVQSRSRATPRSRSGRPSGAGS